MSSSRRFIVRALVADPPSVLRVLAWSVVEAAPALLVGQAVARAIGDGFAAGHPWVGTGWLAALALVWGAAAVGARQVVLAVAAIVEPFRDRLLTRAVTGTLRNAAASGRPPGSAAVARVNLQVELARDALAALVTVVRSFAFTAGSVVLGLATLEPLVLPWVLPPFIVGLLLFVASLPALARRQRDYLLADERTVAATAEAIGGLRDIAACGAEDRVGDGVRERVDTQAAAGRALAGVTALRTVALTVGGWAPVVLLLIAVPWLGRHGVGAAVAIGALTYLTQSLVPAFSGLVRGLGVSAVRLRVAVDRVLTASASSASLASPAETRPGVSARAIGVGRVELRGVTAAYRPDAPPVIDALDLDVRPGEHLAVVGPSGIGKSTLAALITGMLRPRDGTVEIDGIPADAVETDMRVLIPQEAYVFRGTVRENLAYLTPAETAFEQAMAAVGADGLVARLGGLDAEIDPGALSAGERQLIALTRAYLASAPLVVLDEATCHLDPAAEARAETAFARRGGTLIVVAHRISSARRADRVLLMDGTRTHLGTHDELVRSTPAYAALAGHDRRRPGDRDREPERELAP
ncbi:ATP-binding cassette domain-containing protein [Actinomadura rupiterrae]|uniref:ATP-binding cassette domain-containing protein n=1 Tax=Actinomadura rupiterrae TaxID=559627 RepID=UPI0020A38ACC|nr:ABC transporter ATP-binding protein [Actinomadura rupiterrae]MCP2337638.1 ATP-binding cassette subfamily C protein [Actinomadura rupiterrae]